MKQIRRRLLWDGALLVLALASGISVFLARRCNSLVSRSDTATLLFPSLSGGPPHSLSVTREGMTVRVVNQSKDSDSPVWYAESPWNREGDLATIDSVITTLRDLQVVRRLSIGPQATANLTGLGLDRPQSTWQIELNGALCTLKVGANAPPPRSGTYIEVVGPSPSARQFFVVSGDISQLTLQPERLLESRLLPYVPSDVRMLKVDSERNHGTYQFDTSRARWFESDGQHRRISREKIEKLLFDLTNLKSEHFLSPRDDDQSKHGRALATVILELEKPRTQVAVELYDSCGKWPELSTFRISGAKGVAACTSAPGLATALTEAAPSWIDDRLFSVRTDEIESLRVELDGHSLELEREEYGFLLSGPQPRRIDVDTGNELLQTLTSIHGVMIDPASDNAHADLKANNFILVRSAVVGATDRYEERVLIGPEQSGGQRWAKRVADSTFLRLDAKASSSLKLESKLMAPQPSSDPL